MSFDWQPHRWATVADFTAYLATVPPPAWLKAITFHHTAAPTRTQWIGLQHVVNLGVYYRDVQGWPSGPNLFLAAATVHDGIYQGTPILHQGTHAGPCNSSHLGIEIVGNYSTEPWPTPVSDLVYGVMVALCRWANLPAGKVVGHRECMPGHTACPGTKIDPNVVRFEMTRRLGGGVPDYKAIWSAKHPEISFNPTWGIPTLWRKEIDAGRSLGAVLTPEMYNAGDVVVQGFDNGWVSYRRSNGQTQVLR